MTVKFFELNSLNMSPNHMASFFFEILTRFKPVLCLATHWSICRLWYDHGCNMSFSCFNNLDSMAIEHFIPKQFSDSAGNAMGICRKLLCKADTDWVSLTLWTDDECPEFCPVHLLLVYIHLTKIKVVSFPHKNWNFITNHLVVFLSHRPLLVFLESVLHCLSKMSQDCLYYLLRLVYIYRLSIWYLERCRSCYSCQECKA